jgi:Lipase (class 3)
LVGAFLVFCCQKNKGVMVKNIRLTTYCFEMLCSLLIVGMQSCNNKTENNAAKPISASQVAKINQIIYKSNFKAAADSALPNYSVVFNPTAVNGNYAVIVKHKDSNQFALVIRGSLLEFSNDGFQNWVLQDFNIFSMKPWPHTDTVKNALISSGSLLGFNNLLQLKDSATGLNLEDYIVKNINSKSSMVISGHSLGGNLAQVFASYLHTKLNSTLKSKLHLITFGATAAGNNLFVKDLEQKFPLAERYEIDKDIACKFPDPYKIGETASSLGLDSVLNKMGIKLSLNSEELSRERAALSLVEKGLKAFNVIEEDANYAQSDLHKRLLKVPEQKNAAADTTGFLISLFDKAYYYHTIDRYAEVLNKY